MARSNSQEKELQNQAICYINIKVVRDKRTGKTKGYGFVSFSNPTDLAAAIKEMNGLHFCRRLVFGAIGHTSMGGGAFCYIGPVGLLYKENMLGTGLLNYVRAIGRREQMLRLWKDKRTTSRRNLKCTRRVFFKSKALLGHTEGDPVDLLLWDNRTCENYRSKSKLSWQKSRRKDGVIRLLLPVRRVTLLLSNVPSDDKLTS